jgi:hypothetical protein
MMLGGVLSVRQQWAKRFASALAYYATQARIIKHFIAAATR